MAILAVAFDMDGVIAETMEHHHRAYAAVFAPHDRTVEPHHVFAREGQKAPQVVRDLGQHFGLDIAEHEYDAMASRKQEVFHGYGPLPLYPGAEDLVRALAETGVKLALVTGTWRANVDQHLGDLVDVFDTIVAADDVTHTKPHPEPYASAFEHVGVDPADGVVVENAILGIRSARAAGVGTIVAVASTLPVADLEESDADVVLDDLAALRRWFAEKEVLT